VLGGNATGARPSTRAGIESAIAAAAASHSGAESIAGANATHSGAEAVAGPNASHSGADSNAGADASNHAAIVDKPAPKRDQGDLDPTLI
jgi:hypothetical protein